MFVQLMHRARPSELLIHTFVYHDLLVCGDQWRMVSSETKWRWGLLERGFMCWEDGWFFFFSFLRNPDQVLWLCQAGTRLGLTQSGRQWRFNQFVSWFCQYNFLDLDQLARVQTTFPRHLPMHHTFPFYNAVFLYIPSSKTIYII